MSTANKTTEQPKSEGMIKAGHGEFIFRLAELPRMSSNQGHTSPVVEGERIQVGLITKTRGDRARKPHTHPNEQWNYILQGTLRVKIGDQPEQLCGPGTLLYFPANVVHSTAATPEEDVVFFAVKDRSHGMFDNKPAADQ
jgi:quercetin dioxygenase-like cupin family protein